MISDDNRYQTIQGAYCLTSCVSNYINYMGIPFNEFELIFEDDFQMVVSVDTTPKLTVLLTDLVWKFFKKRSVEIDVMSIDSNNWPLISEHILNNQLVIAHLTPNYLNYNKLFRRNKIKNSRHFVNLLGINMNNKVFISDGYIPVTPLQTFHDWTELNIDFNDRNNMVYILNKKQIQSLSLSNDNKYIFEQLKKYMLLYMEGSQKKDCYYGQLAYLKYAEAISDISNIQHNPHVFFEITSTLYTGGVISSKRLLMQIAQRLHLTEMVKGLEEVIRNLYILTMLIMKCKYEEKEYIQDVYVKIKEIRMLEMEIYKRVIKDKTLKF